MSPERTGPNGSAHARQSLRRRGVAGDQRVTRVLLLGAWPAVSELAERLSRQAPDTCALVGYAGDRAAGDCPALAEVPYIDNLAQVGEAAARLNVHEAVLALPLPGGHPPDALCQELAAQGIRVHLAPRLFAPRQAGAPGLRPGVGTARWRSGRLVKRAFDVATSALGLLLSAPLLGLIALAIKADSRGPVLYRHQRVGENGRLFTMLKLRTMRAGSDDSLHKTHMAWLITANISPNETGEGSLKLAGDPRVTRLGAMLRKTSLDELPQLINVLRGEMSLVGPRPPLVYEIPLYQDWHFDRLAALPGMSGLWQVRGRNRVSFDNMVRMDLEYIEHQSVWLDIQLLLETPRAVLLGRGAG